MDQDETEDEDDEEILPEEREFLLDLIALDYDEGHQRAILMAWSSITTGTEQLIRCRDGPTEEVEGIVITVTAFLNTDGLLLHDDVLMPAWSQFSESLSSVKPSDRGFIHLVIKRIHLDHSVLDMLIQAIKKAPVKFLSMLNNGLGSDGLKFVAEAIKVIPELEVLNLGGNSIDSEQDARSLIHSLVKHPVCDGLVLDECNIGSKDAVMEAILPAFELNQVSLQSNGIGSQAVRLISISLQLNPMVRVLDLEGNLLGDQDAKLIAVALKSNTNLRKLHISGNNLTSFGLMSLLKVVHGVDSLDAIYHSNNTCLVTIMEGSADVKGLVLALSYSNVFTDPTINKKIKILCDITSFNESYTNLSNLDDFPVKFMPRVVYFLQGVGFMDETKHNRLDAVYRLIREWSMPLLYTNRVGPEVRRSDRIRRQKVLQLVGK